MTFIEKKMKEFEDKFEVIENGNHQVKQCLHENSYVSTNGTRFYCHECRGIFDTPIK